MSLPMSFGLEGARVLITAGASGIGLATARAFAQQGARVHVCDVDAAALDALGRTDATLGRSTCDVAERASVSRLFDDVIRAFGGLDVLVNNAGIAGPTARCEELDPDAWERTLAVNITGQFHCARLAIPHLRQSHNASIANLSSAAGRFGFPLRTPYSASKWAVIGFTKSLSMELGPDGIRVNAICPGSVAGPRIESVIANKAAARGVAPDVVRDEMVAKASLRRMISPEDVAHAIVFLASPLGASISGHALPIDGDTQSLV
jgi:NAD(P)-dependent dehydrogenase (short-subunit alcohol dehydrogenase family)